MTFGSVCSGIEAASIAWESLGWKAEWLSEIEPFPSALLAHRFPAVPNLGDMTKLKENIAYGLIPAPDVFVGGTPCQAFSVAGLRGGLDDPRGGLTLEFIKIGDAIDEARERDGKEPSIIVWENVPGVLSSKDNAFGAFLGGLCGEECELIPSGKRWSNAGCVYGPKRTVAWRVLDAQYFGVAQRRKRVFVVASARNIDPSQILFEFDGVRRDTPPSREAGETVTEAVGRCSTFKDTPILNDQGGSVMSIEDGLVGTLRRETHGHEPLVFLQGEPTDIHPTLDCKCANGPRANQEGVIIGYAMQAIGEYADLQVSSMCKTRDYKDATDLVVTYPIHDKATRHGGERGVANGLGIGQPTDPCPTLDTGGNHAVAILGSMIGREDKNGPEGDGLNKEVSFTLNCVDRHEYFEQMQVRRLTPVECERLQGFSDGWTRIPVGFYKTKRVTKLRPEDQWEKTEGGWNLMSADGPRYKALGNSMAVPVMRWIGEQITRIIDTM